jgi:hypothetical protein
MGRTDWDVAGLTDLNSRLGREVGGGYIAVAPHIELSSDGTELISAIRHNEDRYRRVRPDREMLTRFAQLWNETPQSILRFARKWGGLKIDKRGRPANPIGSFERRESIWDWKYYSRRAHAVLNIAANLRLGKLGAIEDWVALHGLVSHSGDFLADLHRFGPFMLEGFVGTRYPLVLRKGFKRSIADEKYILSLEATVWLRLGRVTFVVGVEPAGWNLEVDYGGCMLGAVALQIALVLADASSLYKCSGCNEHYIRKKKAPKRGQSNYCDKCGRRKALQRADQTRRGKMAAARRLSRVDGVSISEIAKRLNSRPTTIRRWVSAV